MNMHYPKVLLKDNIDVKSWWSGDKRVEPYMSKIQQALDRSKLKGGEQTDIYNRCYEAIHSAIERYCKK